MTLSLAEELLLLGFDDESGKQKISGDHLDAGLGGATLLELALAERIDVADDRVVVRDPTPVGDPALDQALTRIGSEQKPRKPQWVGHPGRQGPAGHAPRSAGRARPAAARGGQGALVLVRATGLGGKVFPDVDRRTRKLRPEEISRGNWAGDAVKRAVEAIDGAMMAAVVAATTAATAASAGSS